MRSSHRFCFLILTFVLVHFMLPSTALAQASASTNSYLGFQIGDLLPSQVPGVTEIMPLAGIIYGIPQQFSWIEIGLTDSNAKGTSWYDLSASLKVDIPLQSLYGILQIGADVQYYEAPQAGSFTAVAGGHVGAGIGAPVSANLHFRSEMKFNVNPGVTMSVTVGLEYQL